jgi:hypothetical protein
MFISQASRELFANKEPGFFFYYNPRWFIERFLGRTAWLNEIPAEPARWTLMDEIFVKLSGMRAGVTQDIKVCGYNYRGLSCITQNPYYREDQDCPRRRSSLRGTLPADSPCSQRMALIDAFLVSTR